MTLDVRAYLRERVPVRGTPAVMPSGASFAHVFGTVLVFLLGLEAVTGAALAAFYSPSTTDAWASVAYLSDQSAWGWLVRGLHYHGGSALIIVAGVHLVQTAVAGAYKRPRELVWWLGLALLMLVLAWSITGYWLRWDQAAYTALQVELGIAAETPVVGGALRELVLGGNQPGNLTLTRAYALHVIVLPALVTLVTVGHVWLARRHGPTPVGRAQAADVRWPGQTLRDVIALTIVLVVLLAFVIRQHGVELAAPADPTQPHDARPLWPMRWLFELRGLAGGAEAMVALVAPALVTGFLIALPLLDRGAERAPRARALWLGALAGMFAVLGALTVASFVRDASDDALAKRSAASAQLAARARALAARNGVPVTGPLDVYKTTPMWLGRTLYAQRCEGCHAADSDDREGPVIAPGHGDRAWLTAFLKQPSAPAFWGKTKLAGTDAAMQPVELGDAELADLVELLYAESGAPDVDVARRDRGRAVFDGACTDCHSLVEGESSSGPNLAGLGSRAFYTRFVGNPKSALHLGLDKSQMPRFDRELTITELDALAGYLVWLRTATAQDLARLGPP